jgi:dimethylhistidine N-methyltransferase
MNDSVLDRAPTVESTTVDAGDREEFARAVLDGLSRQPRAIPARFLYDARGSALFDAICELPEYYLTRTETKILTERAEEIARLAGPGCALIEFGSGSSTKSRLLLDAMDLAVYAPIDISRLHLDRTAALLRADYPAVSVQPVCADFMTVDGLPAEMDGARRRIGFFPGSTIGNLTPEESDAFLGRARRLVGNDGAMIIGIDLRKDPAALHAAYNDSAGVTAAFTLNLLRRMNRELDGDFDTRTFEHVAFYNQEEGRIEIYFRSMSNQTATVAGRRFEFAQGELVHTEYSYKYDSQGFAEAARRADFRLAALWTDPERLFAVAWLEAR